MKKSPKGRLFGKLDHVGVVVKNLEKAIAYYQSMGIGPFVPNPSGLATDRKLYGKPANIRVKGAIAQMGPIKFELMQPVKGMSLQREFLLSKGEGINHISFIVENIGKEVAKMEKKGFKVISSGNHPSGSFAYLDTHKKGGVTIAFEMRKKKLR